MKARWITDEQNTVPPSTRLVISHDDVDLESCGDDEVLVLGEDDARWLYERLQARFEAPVNAHIPIPVPDPAAPPVATDLQDVITGMVADPMVESAMAMNRLAAVHACDADKPVIEEAILVINLLREVLRPS